MIPSAFVILDTLPLTANGKIDRKALAELDQERPISSNNYVAPRSLDEKILATIWSEILNLEQIGVYDNFFELGGHSLLATQLVSRIRERFHVNLPLRSLFEDPTIAGLSIAIVQAEATETDNEILAQLLDELEEYEDQI
ncbi:MAG: phosphopantetheine-binding protein [Acidobacteriota bacterium]